MPRPYEQSHPWLTFNLKQINDMGPRSWLLMGEARSKCQHLAGAPLQPALAEELNRVTLIRGAQATTAIEGAIDAEVAGRPGLQERGRIDRLLADVGAGDDGPPLPGVDSPVRRRQRPHRPPG